MEKVCWVVAFPHEAKPIIERFSLRKDAVEREIFPVYRSDDGSVALVISGMGKVLSAGATAYLASRISGGGEASSIWINFGIAGSGRCCFGETFVASRITDQGTGRSWYPPAVWSKSIRMARREMLTVDRPVLEKIEGSALIEMEAAGFFSVACKLSTLEFCHAVKIVSDDPEHSVKDIDRNTVDELCRKGLEHIQPWLNDLMILFNEREERVSDPSGFEEWQKVAKFSASQIHQLRKILRQYDSLGASKASLDLVPEKEIYRAKACLQLLREQLDSIRTRIRNG